jgi:hypothetical protein
MDVDPHRRLVTPQHLVGQQATVRANSGRSFGWGRVALSVGMKVTACGQG